MKFRVSLYTVVLAVLLLGYLGSLIPSKKEGLQFTGDEGRAYAGGIMRG